MKRTSALRRRASYVFGLLVFASGTVAGVALADGLPPVLGTSVALPTVSVTTPVATATVATPTVTTPTVTAPVATTVALPAVTTSVAKPVATVTTPAVPAVPAKTVSVAVPALPVAPPKTVSVAVTANPVSATVSAKAAAVPPVHVSVAPAAPTAPLSAAPAAAGAPSVGPSAPAVAAQAVTSAPLPLLQQVQRGVSPLAPLASALPRALQPFTFVQPGRDPGGRSRDAARGSVLLSPLVSRISTGHPPAVTSSVAEIRPVTQPPSSSWSNLRAHRTVVTGGLLALAALAALGLAGAARSPTTVAACAELVRFPFPRFRVLPCPGPGTTVDVVSASHSAVATPGATKPPPSRGAAVHSHPAAGGGPSPGRHVVPRLGGVLGAGISTSHPWELVKVVVLAMLAAANVVLLAVRLRLGRLQGR